MIYQSLDADNDLRYTSFKIWSMKSLLLVLLIASIFIRLYKLGNIPNGLSTDETDLAYNAYLVLKTGADIYGEKLPMFFQSLDDYKPGLVFYTTIPAILAFGLNDFAVRLAPFVFGVLTLFLIFVLTKLLYQKNTLLPIVATVLASFAPWHIALSRAMVWYIELIFLYLLFFVFFLFSQKEKLTTQARTIILATGFIFLSLTPYVYYAAIIYLPLILLTLAYIYRDFVKKNLKLFLPAVSMLIILSIPAIAHYSKNESKTRLNAISVLTADITLPTSIAELEQDKREGQALSQLIHNRRIVYASAILDNYFDYFNQDYLFVNAKNIRYFYVNNVGLFYLLELPFVLYGLYVLIRRREKPDLLILALLVIGPIPAAVTLGSPFPHRALLTILSLQLISAIGVVTFIDNLKKKKFKYAKQLFAILIVVYAGSIYFFPHQYFIHSPREFTSESDNGAWFSTVREAIPLVNQYKDKYDKVVFTWSSQKLVPAVYFLFYNEVDPKIIQEKASGWTNEPPSYRQIYNQIGDIEFRPIDWDVDQELKNTLFIGYAEEFPYDAKIIDKTYLPNGKEHFLFVESQ